jgi:hypothetical protein
MCNYIEIAANVLLTSELEDVIGDVRLSFTLQPGLHAAGSGRGPRADLGLEVASTNCQVVAYYRISVTNYHLLWQPLKKLSILSTFSSKGLEHGLIVTKDSKFTLVVSRYLDPSR